MKAINISFITLITITFFSSCDEQLSKEEQEFDTLMQQVIDVHDEVMPKMSEISSLIKDLEPKIDTTAVGNSYAKGQKDLKDSYDFMMQWMSDFSEKFPYDEKDKKLNPEELASKLKILQEEEVEVKKMRDQIMMSISNAKKMLDQ